MAAGRTLIQQLLEREVEAWRDLPPAEYDHTICKMLNDINTALHSSERVDALLALASKTLRRSGPMLITESRFRCADSLVALGAMVSEPELLLHVRLLFLLAWLQLGAVVERGPDSISVTPSLPPGVMLPEGVDPDSIRDPDLRKQAREAAVRHSEAVERWNAKQRALNHLLHLATLIQSSQVTFLDEDSTKELLIAMSLAPGVPIALRRSLEGDAWK